MSSRKMKDGVRYLLIASLIVMTLYGTILLYNVKVNRIVENVELLKYDDPVSRSKSHYLSASAKPVKRFLTSMTSGRLGNKMGIHAAALGLADINGYKALLHPYMSLELGKYFVLQTPTLDSSAENLTWFEITPTHYIEDKYRHLDYENVRVIGYVNSWTFYHHIRPKILTEFTFKKSLEDEAQNILHQISNDTGDNVTFVGVHVRRGDYVYMMPQVYQGVIADRQYIEKAMNIFRNRYENVVFVVVSDDRRWCRNNIDNSLGDVFLVGNNYSPGQDMATLVACNHTIMTVGTFGFWAAYLCGGDVVYMTNYTLPSAKRQNIPRYNSSFLPEWHGIAADLSPLLRLRSRKKSS